MKEKKHKSDKHKKKRKKDKKSKRERTPSTSSSNSSASDEWVEQTNQSKPETKRDDWMAMTGMIPTYSKKDLPSKQDEIREKKQRDTYDPATNVRELNPYWKNGGTGVPTEKPREFRKPNIDNDFYNNDRSNRNREYKRPINNDSYYKGSDVKHSSDSIGKESKGNWRKNQEISSRKVECRNDKVQSYEIVINDKRSEIIHTNIPEQKEDKYLSDEKMNKLGAKIVKAEIMGDLDLANRLKEKLEAARAYRKNNPEASGSQEQREDIMLTSVTASGSSRPLSKSQHSGDPNSKVGKRKADTHVGGERVKYFGNDDRKSLSQMFESEKYGNNYDNDEQLAKVVSKHKNPNDDLEDIFSEEISRNVDAAKIDEKERRRAIAQHEALEKSLEGCQYCIGSKNNLRHLMVSCGNRVYLALPSRTSLTDGHCIITTVQHVSCCTVLDEDVWEEISNYRRCITQMFESLDQDVVFFETATHLNKYPHVVINCVPMPRDVGDTAPVYFKKALLECEAEWSMNKKVVDLKGKNLRRCVPKGLPYFWVDFGMDAGFAHVIEDQQLFPKNFAEEIIAGILDLDHRLWKRPKRESNEQQRKKVMDFVSQWRPFDNISKK